MAQGMAPALAMPSVGDGSQAPLPGCRTVAGMADGIRSGDSWSEDKQFIPGRECRGIQGDLSSGKERKREIDRAVESADEGTHIAGSEYQAGYIEQSESRSGASAMGLEDHAETVVNAALRALPEFVGMPHQTIPVGEQVSDAPLQINLVPARSRSSEMRNDGRDEGTPNKKLRSHSSGAPMQSPEQNTSFAEMFANMEQHRARRQR